MIKITVQHQLAEDDVPLLYKFADQEIVSQYKVDRLSEYLVGPAPMSAEDLLAQEFECEFLNAKNSLLRHQGVVPIAEQTRQVHVWERGDIIQIDVDQAPRCWVDASTDHIQLIGGLSLDSKLGLELAIGPGIVPLLAKRSIYCLHASCVKTPEGTIAILGESGNGKSTLSRSSKDWRQVGDDILPVDVPERLRAIGALPNFPQLKLIGAAVEEEMRKPQLLDMVLRITNKQTDNYDFELLERREALLEVVRHTVAAKIFDRHTMERHMKFARSLSLTIPVVELSFPRGLERLEELREEIRMYAGGLLNSSTSE